MKTSIAIVDDHRLLAQALSDLIQRFEDYETLIVAENGRDMISYLRRGLVPDIALVDINMPEMDGFQTAEYLKATYPTVKVIALSMTDREDHIVRMVRHGARGYLLKGCHPTELRQALDNVRIKGFHYSEFLTDRLIRSLNPAEPKTAAFSFSDRELDFIKLACSDMKYEEIADKMCVSVRTVDGYRESVFQKLGVKSRSGMIIAAIRLGLVDL